MRRRPRLKNDSEDKKYKNEDAGVNQSESYQKVVGDIVGVGVGFNSVIPRGPGK